ncbi:MAG: hypothetical protein ACRC1H_02520 [Caldilineaceae bacterium]
MSYPSSRRHPRTLREAFPRDPEHAEWLELDQRPRVPNYLRAVILVAACFAIAWLAAQAF